jgi:hypothetical protein
VQVLDNYGYHYAVHDRVERRSHLEKQYYFTCGCIACSEGWPGYSLLPDTNPTYLCTRYQSFEGEGHKQETADFIVSFTLSLKTKIPLQSCIKIVFLLIVHVYSYKCTCCLPSMGVYSVLQRQFFWKFGLKLKQLKCNSE